MALEALGKAIKEGRRSMKLSQDEFAEKCGLDRSYISRAERGRINISYENILKIAHALGLKPSWLLDKADQ